MVVKSATKKRLMDLGLNEPIAHALAGDARIEQVLAYTYPEFMEQLWWGNNGYGNEWYRKVKKSWDDNNAYSLGGEEYPILEGKIIKDVRRREGTDNIGKTLIWEPLLLKSKGETWEDKIKENLYISGHLVTDWEGRWSLPTIKGEDAFNNKKIQRIFLSLNPERKNRGFPEQSIKANYFSSIMSFMNWGSNPL